MADGIKAEIKNYDEVLKQMEGCPKELAKGVRTAMLSMVRRNKSGGGSVMSIASAGVREVYNISKSDFDSRANWHYEETRSVTLSGVTVPFFSIEFKSRPNRTFTAARFAMNPAARPAKRGYVVKWKPLKSGGKVPFVPYENTGQPVFLAPSSAGQRAIPWQREDHTSWVRSRSGGYRGTGWKHAPIVPGRTKLSVPQMIDNPEVQPRIQKRLDALMDKKMDGLIESFNKKHAGK